MDEYTDEIQVLNPKRRSRKRRTMTAKQRRYFGGGRRKARRNPPFMALAGNPGRRRHARRARVAHVIVNRRHARRNPFGGMVGGAVGQLKDGAMGTAGILINNAIGNTVSDMLKVTDPLYRQLVKVATAVAAPTVLGFVSPGLKATAANLGKYAIAHEGAKIVEQKFLAGMGSIGKVFSSSDVPGVSTGNPAATSGRFGYVPNQRTIGPGNGYFGGMGYVPNQAVIGPGAMTPFFAQQTGIR